MDKLNVICCNKKTIIVITVCPQKMVWWSLFQKLQVQIEYFYLFVDFNYMYMYAYKSSKTAKQKPVRQLECPIRKLLYLKKNPNHHKSQKN